MARDADALAQACADAQQCSITFLKPAHHGDVLIARARRIAQQGRTGVYDVEVFTEDGDVIAAFRGNSRTVAGHHVSPNRQGGSPDDGSDPLP